MCHSHAHRPRAASLDHGAAHDRDHHDWTRRDFILRAGLGTAAAVTLGSTRAYALDGGSLLGRLSALDTDRVLVLVQLSGGNDGLNTIVPIRNDLYYQARPSIAIASQDTVALSADVGMHSGLAPLEGLWGDGHLGIVHGVGYDDSSLSHFAATDIWSTARTEPDRYDGGWVGGGLRTAFPTYEDQLPEHPPAVQLGSYNPLLFQSGESDLSMRIASTNLLEQIVAGQGLYDPSDIAPTPSGSELGFIRAISNASNVYIGAVQQAGTDGTNAVEYPSSTLANNLAAVARLIKGGLDSRIYLVSLGGFDTHANQLDRQQTLLGQLGGALAAFQADLGASGDDERVLTMTFSEFGRRVAENGSNGTDHGTAAPLFALGKGVQGGFFGAAPDLSDLDNTGNVRHSTDFRSVYAAALGSWLGLEPTDLVGILGGDYDPVGFVGARGVSADPSAPDAALVLGSPSPNPVRDRARIPFSVGSTAHATIRAFDVRGRLVARLADRTYPPGSYSVDFDASRLPAGVYLLRLDALGQTRLVQATVVR
ncbi:DUF1501 domain-containing protein [Rubrivirga sp. IMCC43871]|uniref:DUF1501 domain-containing protein n=1 Tax=Rubrivirga sp. IMCC43871 TaxID=3391575 RepID=UPI003990332D